MEIAGRKLKLKLFKETAVCLSYWILLLSEQEDSSQLCTAVHDRHAPEGLDTQEPIKRPWNVIGLDFDLMGRIYK